MGWENRRLAWLWLGLMLSAITLMMLAVGLVQPVHAGEATPPNTGTLVVHVENVVPQGGMVRLGLYDEAGYPDDNATPVESADVAAVPGETIVTLHNVPAGTYAIETFQDINSNGKMDSNWIGIPQEPYGFSRDAHPRLSKPGFERVKFAVTAGLNSQTLHLQSPVALVASVSK